MRQGNVSLTISGASLVGQSMAGSFTTDAVNLISIYAYAIQVSWTAGSTPVGTFKLQASNDAGDNGSGQGVSLPVNFTDVTNSFQSISGTPGSIMYDINACAYRWVRLVYTATSGSATVSDATVNVKGV